MYLYSTLEAHFSRSQPFFTPNSLKRNAIWKTAERTKHPHPSK